MTKLLYVFFTHCLNIDNVLPRIKMMMKKNGMDYILVKGENKVETRYNYKERVLTVCANDKYEGLPEKVFKTFAFLVDSPDFKDYTHFLKLDDDMIINKPIDNKDLININYSGIIQYVPGNREWHIGKCSQSSKWNKQRYSGKFVPWCKGGYGYLISSNSIKSIKDDTNYQHHIFEDVCIGIMLYDKNIHPTPINIREYVISPDHR